MKRDAWRRLSKSFLTRLFIPLAVVVLLLFVMELWSLRARVQAERSKPRKPAIERRQDPPVQPQLGRDFTKSGPPAKRDST